MRRLCLTALLLCLTETPALAEQLCPSGTCVPPEDMQVFVLLLQEKRCRFDTVPTLKADSVTILTDRDGRVFSTGSDPMPYRLRLDWCGTQIDATSQIKILVAKRVEPQYGFRFRVKATIGYLPVEAFEEKDAGRGIDGGVLLEPLFYHWANLNVYAGVRSVGAGIGFDVFRNFGFYTGYAMSWKTWRSNPMAAFYFSFW